MSAVAAAVSAPAGQAQLPGIQPAAGAQVAPPATPDAKPAASILGSVDEVKPAANGEQAAQGGESKDRKPAVASELEIKLPDGMQADPAVLAEFKAVAKEAGFTSEQASKLAAWEIQRQTKASEAAATSWQKQGEAWAKEVEQDPDIGGDKLAESVLAAKSVLRKFGGEALAADLAKMGIGNLPSLVRMLARIGKANKEDSSGGGGGTAPAMSDEEAKLRRDYPSMYNEDGTPRRAF